MRVKPYVYSAALILLGFWFATATSAASFQTAKGEFRTLGSTRLTYSPKLACARPTFSKSLRDGVDRLLAETYRNIAQDYLDCMKRVADSDSVYARETIREGYEADAREFVAEYDAFIAAAK